jgi:phospholipase C
VQENHTFDSYFGRWCTAPTGSAPSCTDGAACCERAPDADPSGAMPVVLDDAENAIYDPSHLSACEDFEIDGGKMDRFVANNPQCGDARNLAYAGAATVQPYWDLAATGALADRWFQPVTGQSAANNMYLTTAKFVFADNTREPTSVGGSCTIVPPEPPLDGWTTIGDLLSARGVAWSWYAEGYAAMIAAEKQGHCPDAPDACGAGLSIYPCVFEPDDIPIEYFTQSVDQPALMRDFAAFQADLDAGSLPQVAFVKAIGYRTEHPGLQTNIRDGVAFARGVVDAVARSDYAPDTLVLLLYDEGGGFFDHVAPPAAVDEHPYGTRVPALALGPLARRGSVSHVTLEHSSLVKFLEWNWLGATGQLGARDAVVANLGSLVDATLGVPEN